MKKIIHDPNEVVVESLRGFAAAHADLVRVEYGPEVNQNQHYITLPVGYDSQVKNPVQHEQVIKAGARLAHILMTIWPA